MILAKKIRLYPTEEQEQKLWQSVGTARFIYNWTLNKQEENYKNGGKFISDNDLRKEITRLKKNELPWLNEVSNNIAKQSVKDCCNAYKNFFKGLADKPKFKSRKKSKPSFYINKSREVRRLKKVLRRKQRQCSRKYEMNKKGKEYVKTKNIAKLEKQIKLIHRKLSNIRLNYIHQVTIKIVKTKPSRVVMEDLNVKGMMKNKHLSKSVAEQCLYDFKMKMKYKCEFYGIEFVEADRYFPSSKLCSHCGSIKKDLKLKYRTYKCSCGLSVNRDYNASINLSRYKLAI